MQTRVFCGQLQMRKGKKKTSYTYFSLKNAEGKKNLTTGRLRERERENILCRCVPYFRFV